MKLIVTIDTEEDDWGSYHRTGHTLRNIEKIPSIQNIFDKYNVKPTYLITYPVATDVRARSILKEILDEGRCEIGSHCHPWNTPPFEEETNEYNSMLCNLPPALQYRKLEALHSEIVKTFKAEPTSFRAGRWGFSKSVAENILKLGYKVDSSVTPFCDWSDYYGPDFSEAPTQPTFLINHNCSSSDLDEGLIEIPATVGFLQKNFSFCNKLLKKLKSKALRPFRIIGILYWLKLLNLIWLSPELNSGKEMQHLSCTCKKLGYQFINMMFHSTSLMPGQSPFVQNESDLETFITDIEFLLAFASADGMRFTSLSEAGEVYRKISAQK